MCDYIGYLVIIVVTIVWQVIHIITIACYSKYR